MFANVFSTRTIKYGVRNIFIQTVSKHQKKICESNYQKIEHSIELPLVYVNDPFEFDMKRKVFHEEVQNNEINYKGIPCIFKRKG